MAKKLSEFSGVKGVCIFNEEVTLFNLKLLESFPKRNQFLVESLQRLDVSSDICAFHLSPPPSEVFVINKSGDRKKLSNSNLSILKREPYNRGLFLHNVDDAVVEWLDPDTLESTAFRRLDQPNMICGQYYYEASINLVEFESIEGGETFSINFGQDVGDFAGKARRMYFGGHHMVINYRSGPTLCYSIDTQELLWKKEQNISELSFFHNQIYAVFFGVDSGRQFTYLEVIDPSTGQALRHRNLMPYTNAGERIGFVGSFKIYKDYIFFIGSANRHGIFPVLDHNSLELFDYISIGARCSPRQENFHYIDGKVYILDLNETLHIVEL